MGFYEHRRPSECVDDTYEQCEACGALYTAYEMDFYSGSVAATVGETITGATSGKTAVVYSVAKNAGTYAGGDAVGTIEVTSPSGTFTAGELLNGSTAGSNFATLHNYEERIYGLSYPSGSLGEYEGKKYCRPHLRAKQKKLLDEQVPDIHEEE